MDTSERTKHNEAVANPKPVLSVAHDDGLFGPSSIAWRADFRALDAARALGDPNGALVAMLGAGGGAHLRAAKAALSAEGACLRLLPI